jgi:LysM repeat protein
MGVSSPGSVGAGSNLASPELDSHDGDIAYAGLPGGGGRYQGWRPRSETDSRPTDTEPQSQPQKPVDPAPSAVQSTAPGATATPSTAGTASPGGTNTFNDLAGRDPDLVYAGETVKIEINGKVTEHVVKAGETLSSIAANAGVSVAALIKTNGMDPALLGMKDGRYFEVSGGPHPAPGEKLNDVPAPATTPATAAPTDPTAAAVKAEDTGTQPAPEHMSARDILDAIKKVEDDDIKVGPSSQELTDARNAANKEVRGETVTAEDQAAMDKGAKILRELQADPTKYEEKRGLTQAPVA